KDFDGALQDQAYVPEAEAAHYRGLVQDAIQALDSAAYQTGDGAAFLPSIEKARAILLSDRASVGQRLERTGTNLLALRRKIRRAQEAGQPTAYAAADARVVESFLKYAREALPENH